MSEPDAYLVHVTLRFECVALTEDQAKKCAAIIKDAYRNVQIGPEPTASYEIIPLRK
jgi:hypothetical protein